MNRWRRLRKTAAIGIGSVFAASLLVALAPVPASAQVPEPRAPRTGPSDPRAEFIMENIRNCTDAGFPAPDYAQLYGQNAEAATDGFVSVTGERLPAGHTAIDVEITEAGNEAGVVIDAVVVKGGEGSNIYRNPEFLPPALDPPQNYISPAIEGTNIADVSHYLVCYHVPLDPGPDPDTAPLLLQKSVIGPEGGSTQPLPASHTVVVTCTDPDDPAAEPITDTFTFGSDGGLGRTLTRDALTMPDIPVGWTCRLEEQGTGEFPVGSQVSYVPSQDVVVTAGGTEATVVDDFSAVAPMTGNVEVTKRVIPPANAPVPESFTIAFQCQGHPQEELEVRPGATETVTEIQADSWCTLTELDEAALREAGWEVTYAVNGTELPTTDDGLHLFEVPGDTTVQVVVTNDGSNVPAECPPGYKPDPDDPTQCIPICKPDCHKPDCHKPDCPPKPDCHCSGGHQRT